jgi:hypothetical protein
MFSEASCEAAKTNRKRYVSISKRNFWTCNLTMALLAMDVQMTSRRCIHRGHQSPNDLPNMHILYDLHEDMYAQTATQSLDNKERPSGQGPAKCRDSPQGEVEVQNVALSQLGSDNLDSSVLNTEIKEGTCAVGQTLPQTTSTWSADVSIPDTTGLKSPVCTPTRTTTGKRTEERKGGNQLQAWAVRVVDTQLNFITQRRNSDTHDILKIYEWATLVATKVFSGAATATPPTDSDERYVYYHVVLEQAKHLLPQKSLIEAIQKSAQYQKELKEWELSGKKGPFKTSCLIIGFEQKLSSNTAGRCIVQAIVGDDRPTNGE